MDCSKFIDSEQFHSADNFINEPTGKTLWSDFTSTRFFFFFFTSDVNFTAFMQLVFYYNMLKFEFIFKMKTMFTLYRIVKRSISECVPDRASVHTRNTVFEAFSAPEQYCSDPLLKVERSEGF